MNLINMNIDELIAYIKKKPNIDEFIAELHEHPILLEMMFEIIKQNRGSEKFFCDKVIRITSKRYPSLVYPYFETLVHLMNCDNHFIKWGSIISLSNLISVDSQFLFYTIYEEYFNMINSDSMITSCSVIKQSWRFVMMHPEYDNDLTSRLKQVKHNTYIYQGKESSECKNLVIGAVIDSFFQYFDMSQNQKAMLEFVKAESTNTRASVAKKANKFLKKHTVSSS